MADPPATRHVRARGLRGSRGHGHKKRYIPLNLIMASAAPSRCVSLMELICGCYLINLYLHSSRSPFNMENDEVDLLKTVAPSGTVLLYLQMLL